MTMLLILAGLVALAVLAPMFGVDKTDASSENARPPAGWWPAGPELKETGWRK